jgi:hypothetical protein
VTAPAAKCCDLCDRIAPKRPVQVGDDTIYVCQLCVSYALDLATAHRSWQGSFA